MILNWSYLLGAGSAIRHDFGPFPAGTLIRELVVDLSGYDGQTKGYLSLQAALVSNYVDPAAAAGVWTDAFEQAAVDFFARPSVVSGASGGVIFDVGVSAYWDALAAAQVIVPGANPVRRYPINHIVRDGQNWLIAQFASFITGNTAPRLSIDAVPPESNGW